MCQDSPKSLRYDGTLVKDRCSQRGWVRLSFVFVLLYLMGYHQAGFQAVLISALRPFARLRFNQNKSCHTTVTFSIIWQQSLICALPCRLHYHLVHPLERV